MDFTSLIREALPTFTVSNGTGDGGNRSSRNNIVETLSPLFGTQFNPLLKLFMIFYDLAGSRLARFGLDPAFILTAIGFAWAINKIWMQVYMLLCGLVREYFMSSIHISSNDEMFLHMMKYLASQPALAGSRAIIAETWHRSAWEDVDESDLMTTKISADGSGIFLNFSNQEAKAPPRFTPAFGLHSFWFQGRYFKIHRKQETLYDENSANRGGAQYKDRENLVISCYGRSPDPIKLLLQHAKELYYVDHNAKTIVKRPGTHSMRRFGGRHSWQTVANRPVRPMKTVVLDAKQKIQVLSDMNEYLHPATPKWYANRGIPLRRGFLFHGPPGTGKTSLSFALAGVFGLDIYVISLLDPSLTEEDLSSLFNGLPRRCVVLLEDIDTAGLARPPDPPALEIENIVATSKGNDNNNNNSAPVKEDNPEEKPEMIAAKKDVQMMIKDLLCDLQRQGALNLSHQQPHRRNHHHHHHPHSHPYGGGGGDASSSGEKTGISLSGLLNAIDGVASHEGRVLIMTTNKPENLDPALIRPGRVDLQVAFTNATREQARELFERMYEGDFHNHHHTSSSLDSLEQQQGQQQQQQQQQHRNSDQKVEQGEYLGELEGDTTTTTKTAASLLLSLPEKEEEAAAAVAKVEDSGWQKREICTPQEISEIARQFASKIPPGVFSPAELQGFLLKRKKTPRKALEEVGNWVEGMVEQKRRGGRVLAVQ